MDDGGVREGLREDGCGGREQNRPGETALCIERKGLRIKRLSASELGTDHFVARYCCYFGWRVLVKRQHNR